MCVCWCMQSSLGVYITKPHTHTCTRLSMYIERQTWEDYVVLKKIHQPNIGKAKMKRMGHEENGT